MFRVGDHVTTKPGQFIGQTGNLTDHDKRWAAGIFGQLGQLLQLAADHALTGGGSALNQGYGCPAIAAMGNQTLLNDRR